MNQWAELSLFQKVLLSTDGTVTELIALYAGEPIRVKKVSQQIVEAPVATELGCGDGPTVAIRRSILLSGAVRNYLFAESVFPLARLPASIERQMVETDRPIGLLWKEARLETFREMLGHSVEPSPELAAYFDVPDTEQFIARSYLVHHEGRPFGKITEKWPVSYFR